MAFETYRHFVLRQKYNSSFFEDIQVTAKCRVTFPHNGENEMLIEVGFAICSPKDQFSKKRGRKISEGRLNSPKTCLTYTLQIEPETPLKVHLARILREESDRILKPYDKYTPKKNFLSNAGCYTIMNSDGTFDEPREIKITWLLGSRNSDDFREF